MVLTPRFLILLVEDLLGFGWMGVIPELKQWAVSLGTCEQLSFLRAHCSVNHLEIQMTLICVESLFIISKQWYMGPWKRLKVLPKKWQRCLVCKIAHKTYSDLILEKDQSKSCNFIMAQVAEICPLDKDRHARLWTESFQFSIIPHLPCRVPVTS